jgi:hypothetical protein
VIWGSLVPPVVSSAFWITKAVTVLPRKLRAQDQGLPGAPLWDHPAQPSPEPCWKRYAVWIRSGSREHPVPSLKPVYTSAQFWVGEVEGERLKALPA